MKFLTNSSSIVFLLLTLLNCTSDFSLFPSDPSEYWLAFTSTQSGISQIYRIRADGTDLQQLTHDPATSSFSPAWSPDGDRIAFVRWYDFNREIYTMKPDGSDPIRLTNYEYQDIVPVWSPNGLQIAFFRSNDELMVMNRDGTDIRQLTVNNNFISAVSWSPDGSRLIMYTYGSPLGITIYMVDGSGILSLAEWTDDGSYPAWSPYLHIIAFSAILNGVDGIFTMRFDGTRVTSVTSVTNADMIPHRPYGSDYDPQWSPQGDRILFRSARGIKLDPRIHGGYEGICVINSNGTNLKVLSNGIDRDINAAWSPDGRMIAFQRERSEYSNSWDIWVMESDGSNPMNLTDGFGSNRDPTWAPIWWEDTN